MATITRRGLLRATAVGAAVGIIGLRKKSASADSPPRAKRLLIFNASGGIRNTAAFNASTDKMYNPWGVLGTFGYLKLGKVLTSTPGIVSFDAPSWPGAPQVPGIEKIAAQLSILGAVNHDRVGYRAGDHSDETPRMGTGYYGTNAPGAMTLIWSHLKESKPPLPVVAIGGSCGSFAAAHDAYFASTPVGVNPQGLPKGAALAPLSTTALEDAVDRTLRTHRNGIAGDAIDGYASTKAAIRAYGPALTQPALHLDDPANFAASVNGITNRMLLEAVGNIVTLTSVGDVEGLGVAQALRMLQMGAPAAVVGVGQFDHHSNEDTQGPALYSRYARMLAGIHFALSHIPDPSGVGSMLDNTLVVTTSEFDRSREKPAGFNPAGGSNHPGADDKHPHQPHVVFGAKIAPKVLAPTDDGNQASKQYSTHALLSTMCQAIGVPAAKVDTVWPPGSSLYPEAGPIWDLWA